MPRRSYQGKAVVITGAAGGLGRAFARRFARAGARLGLLDRDAAGLEGLAAELRSAGADCVSATCDITDEAQCRQAVAEIGERLGGVYCLINNAGVTHRSPFAATSGEVYRRVMAVNYFGAIYCTQAALPWLLAQRGQIVVISSVAGFAPLLGRTGYAGAKHALQGFFASLRTELRPRGVGVTIVCPGFTATGIAHAALDGDGGLTSHPQSTVGRVATPEEVAEALFRAASRDRSLTVLSLVGKLTWVVSRLAPGLYERLMANSLRSELER